jgi:threonine dehydratase
MSQTQKSAGTPVPPDLPAIRAAAARNRADILVTPIHRWRGVELDERVGADTEVVLKLELFQHTGSFKPRGALAVVDSLDADARRRGLTAVSAGNHAIAVAYAAARRGLHAKVVMLRSASAARVARCKQLGAEVLMSPGGGAEAFALADQLRVEEGRTFVHPFEGPLTTLGTATLGLEFAEQAGPLDALIVPVGGGGLISGVASAFKAAQPGCCVYGVEPEGADTMHRSFAAGSPQRRDDVATIADSLAPPYALPYSFGICRQVVDRLVMVSDEQIVDAMAVLFREMKLAVEPAGAAATAALFGPLRDELRGRRVGVIVCGANIDIETFGRFVGRGVERSGRL